MKGIQDQYIALVQGIIEEQFPAAVDAGVVFSFSELDPTDAKDIAAVEKIHADIIKIYKEVGASDEDLKALSAKYELVVKSEAVEGYSDADMALAGRTIAQIMDDAEEDIV
jgi:hypothetical protein